MNDTLNDTPEAKSNIDIEAIKARNEAAWEMITALCKPKGTKGSREWIMSIPVQPDYDPDTVIGAALEDVQGLIPAYELLSEVFEDYDPIVEDKIGNLNCEFCDGEYFERSFYHDPDCLYVRMCRYLGMALEEPHLPYRLERII